MRKCHALFAAALLFSGFAVVTVSTAEAAVCRARVAGHGSGKGILGKGTERARAAARLDWSREAKIRYGSRFTRLSKASDVRWTCKRTPLIATCVVTAKPCR